MKFNPKKNKVLVTIVVLFVIIGLVMVYIPLIFSPHSAPQSQAPTSPHTASILPPAPTATSSDSIVTPEIEPTDPSVAVEEPPTLTPVTPSLEGFSGLEAEQESLGDLDDFLQGLE